jgi:hypothetical protein
MLFHGRCYALCDETVLVLRVLFRTIGLDFRTVVNGLEYAKAAAFFSKLPC